jgi:hypothetical protein
MFSSTGIIIDASADYEILIDSSSLSTPYPSTVAPPSVIYVSEHRSPVSD